MEREWVPMTSLMQQIIGLTYENFVIPLLFRKFRVLDLKAERSDDEREEFFIFSV
jgi:hypothetical protein